MNKQEATALALRAKWQGKIATLQEKTRQGVDVAEIGAGAGMAGYLDVAIPSVMGVPTSAAIGIALFVAGQLSEQRDLSMLGTGVLAGAAYKQGQALAQNAKAPAAPSVVNVAAK